MSSPDKNTRTTDSVGEDCGGAVEGEAASPPAPMETTSPVSLEDVVAEDEEQEEGAAAGPPEEEGEKSSPHAAVVPPAQEDEGAEGREDRDTAMGKGHKGAAAGTHNDKGDDKRDEPTAKQIENEMEEKVLEGGGDDDGNGSGEDKGEHKCAKCKKHLPSDLNRFHCNECKDKSFDLCEDCYFTVEVQHVHAPLVLIKALDPPTILFSYQDSLTGHTVYLSNSTAALQRSKALRQKLGISAVLSLLEITPDHLINEIYRGQREAGLWGPGERRDRRRGGAGEHAEVRGPRRGEGGVAPEHGQEVRGPQGAAGGGGGVPGEEEPEGVADGAVEEAPRGAPALPDHANLWQRYWGHIHFHIRGHIHGNDGSTDLRLLDERPRSNLQRKTEAPILGGAGKRQPQQVPVM
ncbi:hypothetical protein Pelo_9484 [Pelomyxa schiedti]|nr:hypothetical protein Pelo_9484 [Pelomyxa schiedti]